MCAFLGAAAHAQNCPDFFRFVDFGQDDVNGLARGGTLIRVESLEGRPLIKRAETACTPAQFLASDGHGNPIPVVTSITFDPEKLPFEVSAFEVNRVEDAFALAEKNAQAHRDALGQSTIQTAQGESHLCAGAAETLSCQLVSPFAQTAPLVVYCDKAACEMSVLSFNKHVAVTAVWPLTTETLEAAGTDIAQKLQEISAFLETQH